MPDGGDEGVGSYHHMVADTHLVDVEDGEVVVACEVVADEDVRATVAVEALGYPDPFAHTAEH